MQCPNCNHEAPQIEFGDPLRCPDCGAYYEKAVALRLKLAGQALQQTREVPAPVAPVSVPKPRKKTSWVAWVLGGLMLIGLLNMMLAPPPVATSPSVADVPEPKQEPIAVSEPVAPPVEAPIADESALSMTQLEFKGHKDGGLLYVDFTVINNGSQQIKDIEIECVHNGKSGSRIDSNTRTIYDVVGPRSRKTFKRFSMGIIHSQATQTRCSISGLKV